MSLFSQSIATVFKGWTALQLAVLHSFGGPDSKEKAEWLITATEDWFKLNKDIDPLELEDFLADILSHEFETIVDDNSLAEVASRICMFSRLCDSGQTNTVKERMAALKGSAVDACQAAPTHEESDEDDNEEDMDVSSENLMNHMNATHISSDTDNVTSSPAASNTDEDGWTTVPKSNRRRK